MTILKNPEGKPTVDYGSDHVACGFDLRGVVSPERIARLVDLIGNLVDPRSPTPPRLLDMGCGTGRFAIPLACRLEGFSVTGADASARMLEEARLKPNADRVTWSVQDICSQTFESGSFDLVFISDVLHHVDDALGALRECHRVLRPGGWLICKYGAMEDIAHDPEHTFFPGANSIDETRTPTKTQMIGWLEAAGFARISSRTENERTRATGACRLLGAQAQSISVLHLIQTDQFAEGLRRLSEHVAANPNDPWLLVDPTTWTWAQRPA